MIIGVSKDNNISVAANCIICNREILLPVTHAIQETILCQECKKRLKVLLYNIGELEEKE